MMGNQIAEDIYWVGANDHVTHLFESIWPLPQGISYNAYLLRDEKTVLFDTVKDAFFPTFLENIKRVLNGKSLDYLVIHHLEPDHSGSLKVLLESFPDLVIIGNSKTKEFLGHQFDVHENIQTIEDGQELNLGRHTLQFHLTPMIHWPETMMTIETTGKILFSGDAFGSFGAIDGALFDSQLDLPSYEDEILRYFSNIVGKYAPMVQRGLAKLQGAEIEMIAPTHGPIWKADPQYVLGLYDRWSRYESQPGAVLLYGSMYGNTEKMCQAVAAGLRDVGVKTVVTHNVATTHNSYIVRDVWRWRGLLIGCPTYDMKVFPPMDDCLRLLGGKKIQQRVVGIFGTYGWSGGGVKGIREFVEGCKLDLTEPVVETRFHPGREDLDACYQLGLNVGGKITEAP